MPKPQHQGAPIDQLTALLRLANAEGLYDAADLLRQIIEYRTKPVILRKK